MTASVTDPIVVAFTAGLCAMLGGVLGALLARRTEYEKWLRQERNSAFARFLTRMKEFRLQALDIILSTEGDELKRGIGLSELKMNFEVEENVVRLYLNDDDRANFTKTMKDLRDAYDPMIKQKRRFQMTESVNQDVQYLFERALHSNH
jgi:hypothetical protein